jgi:DNA gyrase subunit A
LAKRKVKKAAEVIDYNAMLANEDVLHSDFTEEMKDAMLNYSIAVITDRALPNVYDGCKPVIRRILFGCFANGYLQSKPYKKNAKIVGDVMGSLHPHGQRSILS